MKLKPISEIAEECDALIISQYDSLTDGTYSEYTLCEAELEALRTAIIKDFVTELIRTKSYRHSGVLEDLLVIDVTDLAEWEK